MNRRTILAVVVVAAIIIILAAGAYFLSKPKTGEQVTRLESGDELVTAAAGEVVSDFPQELVLEPQVTIQESYSLRYLGDGVTQPVVEYVSGLTLTENIDLFDAFFFRSGWELTHRATLEEAPITYFYALRGHEQANVSFLEMPDYQVKVTVAYAVKAQ